MSEGCAICAWSMYGIHCCALIHCRGTTEPQNHMTRYGLSVCRISWERWESNGLRRSSECGAESCTAFAAFQCISGRQVVGTPPSKAHLASCLASFLASFLASCRSCHSCLASSGLASCRSSCSHSACLHRHTTVERGMLWQRSGNSSRSVVRGLSGVCPPCLCPCTTLSGCGLPEIPAALVLRWGTTVP